ncbi:MAG: hypothetical protein PHY81_04400 [Candidatus Bipolaricaulis anaerobius]|nr:hypothetical protein [Candidatus Bipolaricaulis anaerobius]MDD5764313.1 hypothetical protein [Candidatus Bipolaricaulis anaerobius]
MEVKMTDDRILVKVEGPGVNVERDVPVDVGLRVLELLLTGDLKFRGRAATSPRPETGEERETSDISASAGEGKLVSVRTYLNQHEPKRAPDKITAIGCYLKEHRGASNFTKDDLVKAFEEAAEPIPANPLRDLKWAVRIGWVAQKPGEKGVYYVTNDGEQAVRQRFPRELLKKTGQQQAVGKRRSRKRNNKEEARDEVNSQHGTQ